VDAGRGQGRLIAARSARRGARTLAAAGVLALGPLAVPSGAAAATQSVNAQFSAFGPSQTDVLPGETVEWTNVSDRSHTVTSDTGLFDSGDFFAGERFVRQFDDIGAYAYHCMIHEGMVGEIDVRGVILGPLPTAPVPSGDGVDFTGRTADVSQPVRIQRSEDGVTFATVASAMPAPDGTWTARLTAQGTGDYRAASGIELSQTRRLLVSDRRVVIHPVLGGVRVTVTPSAPYARVVLQLDLRERFGWWPTRSTRLDYVSQAQFRVGGPARARVVLVDKDGWTPLAISPVVVLRSSGRR
jgi:plastocyanin